MKRWLGFWLLGLGLLTCGSRPAAASQLGWRKLFDGHDLKGWKHVGPGGFIVKHGLLTSYGGMGLLYWTGGPVGDCEIRVVYRMTHENDDSGVFIRIPSEPADPWMALNLGYKVQIDNHPEGSSQDDYHLTGALSSMTRPLAKPGLPGPQWNTMLIRIAGRRTQVFVNDVKVTDYTEGQPVPPKANKDEPDRGERPDEGWIGLQNHSDSDSVQFKQIGLMQMGVVQP